MRRRDILKSIKLARKTKSDIYVKSDDNNLEVVLVSYNDSDTDKEIADTISLLVPNSIILDNHLLESNSINPSSTVSVSKITYLINEIKANSRNMLTAIKYQRWTFD